MRPPSLSAALERTTHSMTPNKRAWTTRTVTSLDGTVIGYRRAGKGPGLVLLHGGLQSSSNLTSLGELLADDFTVTLPDRRGRGLSGPAGNDYGMARECEDLGAVLADTGARDVFGLSSGALVALEATRTLPDIDRVALYEPPLPVPGTSPVSWSPRFEREIAEGDDVSAFVTVVKGIGDPAIAKLIPRFLLVSLIRGEVAKEAGKGSQGDGRSIEDLIGLVPTMSYDVALAQGLEGRLDSFQDVEAPVLLLGGTKSPRFLKKALDALERVVPRVERAVLPGVSHTAPDNGGRPDLVAAELRSFFGGPTHGAPTEPAPRERTRA